MRTHPKHSHRTLLRLSYTYRTVRPERLYAAGVVVVNTAARLSLQVFEHLDETDDLGVLVHAGGELGSQMDQVFLKGGGKVNVRRRGGGVGGLETNYRLTEVGPIQMLSCWVYLTLSWVPLFFSTYRGRQSKR